MRRSRGFGDQPGAMRRRGVGFSRSRGLWTANSVSKDETVTTIPPAAIGDSSSVRVALEQATDQLLSYCRRCEWAGHDPYDALNSRVLRRWGLLRWRFARLAFTQFLKLSPVNLRGLLGVPREQNPKGLAVFLSALTRLHRLGMERAEGVRALASRLLELRSPGQRQSCWGYNFDWQSRGYLVPRGTPNIICTTFAANALLDAYEELGEPHWLQAARSAGTFLLEGLNTTREADRLCFSYTPLDHSQIHNASLLGAALLARLHAQQPSEVFRSAAHSAARYSLVRQRPDGSWPYGEGNTQKWIDGFHTGFNLMALERVRQCLPDAECEPAIRRGYVFYLDHFFAPGGVAKYFHNRVWPVDSHSVAQALITLCGLADYDRRGLGLALQVCGWALREMRSPEGWFYFQKRPFWTNRICYMRWSQAWMLLAMADLLQALTAAPRAQTARTAASP